MHDPLTRDGIIVATLQHTTHTRTPTHLHMAIRKEHITLTQRELRDIHVALARYKLRLLDQSRESPGKDVTEKRFIAHIRNINRTLKRTHKLFLKFRRLAYP
jgi:hypothetical protein